MYKRIQLLTGSMIVIFQNRGKQYKAKIGDFLKVPIINNLKKDDSITFEEIIFFKNEKGDSFIGSPLVEGISMKAKVVDQIKDKKIIVFKKKRRKNYRRKIGHRQDLTLLKVEEIKMVNKTTQKKPEEKKSQSTNKTTQGESNGS